MSIPSDSFVSFLLPNITIWYHPVKLIIIRGITNQRKCYCRIQCKISCWKSKDRKRNASGSDSINAQYCRNWFSIVPKYESALELIYLFLNLMKFCFIRFGDLVVWTVWDVHLLPVAETDYWISKILRLHISSFLLFYFLHNFLHNNSFKLLWRKLWFYILGSKTKV